MVIKRVGVWSVAKMYGALSGAMGLLFGIILGFASMVGVGLAEGETSPFMGVLFGAGAIVALPLFYGVMGVVVGAVGALIYNAVAAVVGGITIDVE